MKQVLNWYTDYTVRITQYFETEEAEVLLRVEDICKKFRTHVQAGFVMPSRHFIVNFPVRFRIQSLTGETHAFLGPFRPRRQNFPTRQHRQHIAI